MDQVVEHWRCPDCGLSGATAASMPEATSLAAHARVLGCDLEPPAPAEWTAAGAPAPPARKAPNPV